MSIVLGVDAATNLGLAFYDLDRPIAEIECGHVQLVGTPLEKIRQLRKDIVPVIKSYHGDNHRIVFAAIEKPLPFVNLKEVNANRSKSKRARADMFDQAGEGVAPAKRIAAVDIYAKDVIAQIVGAVCMMLDALHVQDIELVAPKTWQKILPASCRIGSTKQNAAAYCRALGIAEAGNEHEKDAALIAVWAAGRHQALSLARRTAA